MAHPARARDDLLTVAAGDEDILAFVHIEKAAGSSTHEILKRSFGPRYCPVETWRVGDDFFSASDMRWLRILYPRLEAAGGHWLKPYGDLGEACPDLRWWTILRDPLVRCASHYQYQAREMGKTESFETWIRRDRYRNFQTRKIAGSEDAEAAIRLLEERFLFVGLAERFDESLLLLDRILGGGVLRVAPTLENVARDDAMKQELLADPARRELLEEANRSDRRVYEHVIRDLYPRQRERWGRGLERELADLSSRSPAGQWRSRLSDLKRYTLYKPVLHAVRRIRA